jgi:hypothetical protein
VLKTTKRPTSWLGCVEKERWDNVLEQLEFLIMFLVLPILGWLVCGALNIALTIAAGVNVDQLDKQYLMMFGPLWWMFILFLKPIKFFATMGTKLGYAIFNFRHR